MDGGVSILFSFMPRSSLDLTFLMTAMWRALHQSKGVTPGKMIGCGEWGCEGENAVSIISQMSQAVFQRKQHLLFLSVVHTVSHHRLRWRHTILTKVEAFNICSCFHHENIFMFHLLVLHLHDRVYGPVWVIIYIKYIYSGTAQNLHTWVLPFCATFYFSFALQREILQFLLHYIYVMAVVIDDSYFTFIIMYNFRKSTCVFLYWPPSVLLFISASSLISFPTFLPSVILSILLSFLVLFYFYCIFLFLLLSLLIFLFHLISVLQSFSIFQPYSFIPSVLPSLNFFLPLLCFLPSLLLLLPMFFLNSISPSFFFRHFLSILLPALSFITWSEKWEYSKTGDMRFLHYWNKTILLFTINIFTSDTCVLLLKYKFESNACKRALLHGVIKMFTFSHNL